MKEERNKTLQQQTTDKYNRFQVVTVMNNNWSHMTSTIDFRSDVFTARNEACVKNSVHGGGGGGVHGAGSMHGRRACVVGGGMRGRRVCVLVTGRNKVGPR